MERTEPASEKRIQQSRQRGEHAASSWLTSGVVALAIAQALPWLQHAIGTEIYKWSSSRFAQSAATKPNLRTALNGSLQRVVTLSISVLALLVVAALAARLLQVGLRWSASALWNPERIRPSAMLTSFGKPSHFVSVLRDTLGVLLVLFVVAHSLLDSIGGLYAWSTQPPKDVLGHAPIWFVAILRRVGLVMLAVGLGDLLYQRWRLARDLRMTRQEVLQELRETEGNPLTHDKQKQAMQSHGLRR